MITIDFKIDDADYPTFMQCLLREQPQTPEPVLDDNGKPTYDENGILVMANKYTDIQWIKQSVVEHLAKICTRGAKKIKLDEAPLDEEMIQRVKTLNI